MTEPNISVVVLKTEPWIHAVSSQKPNETLCGVERVSDWFDSTKGFLDMAEALPRHRVYGHICGICWWKYAVGT